LRRIDAASSESVEKKCICLLAFATGGANWRPHPHMQCNWLAVVRGDGGARACVFCGQHRRQHGKHISVASVLGMLRTQSQALQEESFARTLRNMCQAALDSHAHCSGDEREAHFSACLCCHHWVARRVKTQLVFPMQALSWYVNTMQTLGGKNMDHRVVMRLCQVLSEGGPVPAAALSCPALSCPAQSLAARSHPRAQTPTRANTPTRAHDANTPTRAHNTYCALFNVLENSLFARIAAGAVGDVGGHMAAFYHSQNACTIFSPSCALVEKLRKNHAGDRSASPAPTAREGGPD